MIILSVLGALAALEAGVAATAVTVGSDSQCPSADAVREALESLGGRNAPRPASATVGSRGDRLTVELSWPEDSQSETRELTVESDCDSRAQSAAVIIASWLGILPEATLVSTPLGAPPVVIPNLRTVPREPEKTPAVESSTITRSIETPARPFEVELAVADGEPSGRPPLHAWRSWLGVSLGGVAGGGVVPGLRVELLRARSSAGFDLGWVASTLASMPRSKSLDGGTSSWIRPAVGLASTASFGGPRLRLAMDLGPLVGLTVAWGSGYPSNQTDASPTWGVTGGLRLQLALASSRLWGELRVVDWLHAQSLQHEIQPTGIVGSADLPSLEVLLSLGWSFAI